MNGFREICKKRWTVCECVCVFVCVCVRACVCVCVNREHRSYLIENKKYKNDFCLPSNLLNEKIVLRDLTCYLKVKKC